MADQNITELPVKTSSGITSSDYMLGIDSAEGYQMLIRDLGDYIIRNVQVNTIAGSNQTLKSALDTLNSKTYSLSGGSAIANNTDLNDLRTVGNYYSYTTVTLVNGPVASFSGILKVEHSAGQNDSYLRQTLIMFNSPHGAYARICEGTTWTTWELIPQRSEIDALINSLDTKDAAPKTIDANSLGNGIHTHSSTSTNIPVSGMGGTILSLRNNYNSQGAQLAQANTKDGFYYRNLINSTWGNWAKLPTRDEVDALNSNLANKSIDISGITTTHTIGSGSGIYRTGNVIYEHLAFTLTSNVTAFGTVATLPATARPIVQYLGFGLDSSNNPVPLDITYNGLIRTWKALNSGDTLNFAFTYILQ